jgi:hypothetical protein
MLQHAALQLKFEYRQFGQKHTFGRGAGSCSAEGEMPCPSRLTNFAAWIATANITDDRIGGSACLELYKSWWRALEAWRLQP